MKKAALILAVLLAVIAGALLLKKRSSETGGGPETKPEAVATVEKTDQASQPPSASATVTVPVTQEGSADKKSAAKSVPLTREEFRTLAQKVLESIPAKDKLQEEAKKNVHGAPDSLFRAGLELGSIYQAVKDNPSLAPDAVEFYSACAKDEKRPDTVRALCFSHYRKIGAEIGASVDMKLVPEKIKVLSDKVMQL